MTVAISGLEQLDAITKEDKVEFGMNETLKERFLEKSICYYCGEDIHNYESSELFDGRIVKSCFECYNTIEIGKAIYYCQLGEIDIPWETDDV